MRNKLSILADKQQLFHIYDMYKHITMDFICQYIETRYIFNWLYSTSLRRSTFNIKTHPKLFRQIVQLSNWILFLKSFLRTFFLYQLKIIEILGNFIPFLNHFMEELSSFSIINRVQEVIDHRKLHLDEHKRIDLLQMIMVDANVSDEKNTLIRLQKKYKRNIDIPMKSQIIF